ncbi:hypothetical protein LSCM1_06450 [Leishmania martiniquensis]|uniref:Uncharacterized protein n=1 Tax=Leishmania martiniquensis TaxID=1580590 RepID=A0A836GTU5_9TRYP|nr:hypothetical protein LSCM1_06450 [Leishmania martiniquensis]
MLALFFACLAPKRRLSGSTGTTTAAAAAAAAPRRKRSASTFRHRYTPRVRIGSSPRRRAGRSAKKDPGRCTRVSRALSPKPLSAPSPSASSSVLPRVSDAPVEAIAAPQPRLSPSYVIAGAMPVRSHFMNPVDFLSSSEPLLLTPEEKAAEKAERARLVALQDDARALAAAFARELAERKAKATPAAAEMRASKARLNGTPQQRPPTLHPRSSDFAPVAPTAPRRRHKSSFKAKKERGKTVDRRRRPNTSPRPRAPTRQCASPTRSGRRHQPKVRVTASVPTHKPLQALHRPLGGPRLRPTAAARIRAATAAAFSQRAASSRLKPVARGKKRPAVSSHRTAKAPTPVLMRALSKSTVKASRLAKPKKRIITKLRHRRRKR